MNLPKEFQYAYHRTNEKNVSSIARSGFIPGSGDMYGRGWYMCYDLESQLQPKMAWYGEAVIKSEIFSKGLLIFDYNVSKRVYGSNYSLVDQAIAQGIWKTEEEMPLMFIQMSQVLSETFHQPKFSAAIAANAWMAGLNPRKVGLTSYSDKGWRGNPNSFLDPSKGTPKNKKITSIMFTGNHDGNVVVVYNPNTAKPLEYALLPDSVLQTLKSPDDIPWLPLDGAEEATKRAELTREVFKLFNGKCLGIEFDPASKIRNLSAFKAAFPWLLKGDFSDAEFLVNDHNMLQMNKGEWKGGTFKGYVMMKDVVFKSGIFEGDLFLGQWLAGRWGHKTGNGWGGWTVSKSKFTYEVDDEEYEVSKETPDVFFK